MPSHRTLRHLLPLIVAALLLPAPAATAQETPTPDPNELASSLPPVDLPTMNALSYVFTLESTFTGDDADIPQDVAVYTFEERVYTEEEVVEAADALGVDGEIVAQGEGTYTVEGNGTLYTTPGLLQYVSSAEAPDEALPDDEAAIGMAREWLRTSGLLPADIGEGSILATIEEPGRKIVGFAPASPAPLLSSTPGLTVTVGPGGVVLEARSSWASVTEGDLFRLRTVDDAFTQVASRQSYLDLTLPEDRFPQGSEITGNATYSDVTLAWTGSGSVDATQILQPVYVFTGTVTPEGSDEAFPITSYVPAIISSLQPVGAGPDGTEA